MNPSPITCFVAIPVPPPRRSLCLYNSLLQWATGATTNQAAAGGGASGHTLAPWLAHTVDTAAPVASYYAPRLPRVRAAAAAAVDALPTGATTWATPAHYAEVRSCFGGCFGDEGSRGRSVGGEALETCWTGPELDPIEPRQGWFKIELKWTESGLELDWNWTTSGLSVG